MRKHISVLMLMARCSIGRAAVLLVLMAAAQCLTFYLALSQGVTSRGFSLEMVVQNSGMRWILTNCCCARWRWTCLNRNRHLRTCWWMNFRISTRCSIG